MTVPPRSLESPLGGHEPSGVAVILPARSRVDLVSRSGIRGNTDEYQSSTLPIAARVEDCGYGRENAVGP
jgi:hypothetical protein